MILGFLTLLIALAISAVSAYFSILGLVAIFAAAVGPVIIMGSAIELGKLATAVWLHKNWHRAGLSYKLYLVPALVFLMLLTSMGTYGYLSKAHVDQGVPTGNVQAQLGLIDTKIDSQRENINAARKNIKQLDDSVDQVLARSTSEQGAARSAQLRRSQAKDRSALQTEIEAAQKSIAQLQEERAKISVEMRKVEAEVGPIKYVAALIYGDNPNADLLERAVRWVIMLIVVVFDPLAIVLILAGSRQIEWGRQEWSARRERKLKAPLDWSDDAPQVDEQPTSQVSELTEKLSDANAKIDDLCSQNTGLYQTVKEGGELYAEQTELVHELEGQLDEQIAINDALKQESTRLMNKNINLTLDCDDLEDEIATLKQERDRLFKAHKAELTRADDLAQQLEEVAEELMKDAEYEQDDGPLTDDQVDQIRMIVEQQNIEETETPVVVTKNKKPRPIKTEGVTQEAVIPSTTETINTHLSSISDETMNQILFGPQFPKYARSSDIYIRTDVMPHRVYKFNGNKWMILDKVLNTTYLQYIPYIQYLIKKLDSGEYDADMLTEYERDEIEHHLSSK